MASSFRTRSGFKAPDFSAIRTETERVFKKRPCLLQVKACNAILRGDNDVTCIARTGLGKTLTFWMPLLFVPDGIQIVVTPLNILGRQNVDELEKEYGFKAIAIDAESATPENFKVRSFSKLIMSLRLTKNDLTSGSVTESSGQLLLAPSRS